MVEWNYAKEADITIGEVRISTTAKVLLIILIVMLIISAGAGIYFRKYIYDFIINPQVVLTDEKVTVEVHNKVVPEDYIVGNTSEYTYTVEGIDDVNIDKLGTYKITYNSKNRIKSNSTELTIEIVDTTEPEIILTDDVLKLVRGSDDTKNFKAIDYIKEVKDNYSKAENIKIDYTKSLDFDKDELEVQYSATDESGNMATAKLSLIIVASEEELIADYEKQKAKEEEEQKKKDAEEAENNKKNNTDNNNNNNNNNNTQQTTQAQTQAQTEAPTEAATEAPAPDPYIAGVHNVTVAVGSDVSSMVNALVSGVSGSGYVSCDYSGVNLTVPGTYTVYWSSSDGASATCSVTVTE